MYSGKLLDQYINGWSDNRRAAIGRSANRCGSFRINFASSATQLMETGPLLVLGAKI